MAIHHATMEKAKKMGVIMTEKVEDGVPVFSAHWTKRNVKLSGENAKLLLNEMEAAIEMKQSFRSFKWKEEEDGSKTVTWGEHKVTADYLHQSFATMKKTWQEERAELDEEDGDDEAETEEEDAEAGGSVVAPHYRAKYAEAGHPTHCGDWLAVTLNNLCLNEKGTNVEFFQAICEANGLNMDKYDRTSHGWQGRFRMTGRNLLGRAVFMAGGVLKVPNAEDMQAPAEWMDGKRYKAKKAKAA